jgi:hypothetical protein
MNTAALKRFAQQARVILIEGVQARLMYWGFDTKGNVTEKPVSVGGGVIFRGEGIDDPTLYKKWIALERAVKIHGVEHVAEEAAYTWFNRLMAIRILAKNGYIRPQLEYESELLQVPMIVGNARRGQVPQLTAEERIQLHELLKDDSAETPQFTLLITAFCRTNKLLRRVFGRLDDYTELLLPRNILSGNGFIHLLNNNGFISAEDYKQVELIGWLYQFYISEKKDEVFKSFKNKKKAEAEDIPAATQIFTPNWIVKYMVQNTVGRIWLDLNPDSNIKSGMAYLVENPDAGHSEPLVSDVSEIKLLDPACGSGHILVEGFDLLFAMYTEEGYSKRGAVREILRQNLYGLDIDLRAVQLANFALLLKAAAKDPAILEEEITPRVYAMPEPYEFSGECVHTFLGDNIQYTENLREILALMLQAQNLGSIMQMGISPEMRICLQTRLTYWEKRRNTINNIFLKEELEYLFPYIRVILLLTTKYEAVAANPPYMGSGNMNGELKEYVNKNYFKGKSDLATVFMQFFKYITIDKGLYSFITPPSWMFLSTYEDLRKEIIEEASIDSLLHLSRGVFGADFGSVSTVIKKGIDPKSKGVYYRLVERTFQEFEQDHLRILFLKTKENHKFRYLFAEYTKEVTELKYNEQGARIYYAHISQSNFEKIPGSPIAYWVSERVTNFFKKKRLDSCFEIGSGLSTSDNSRFLRFFWEVDGDKISRNENEIQKKWFFFQKGGEFRKWYGNLYYVVNWEKNGEEIKYWVMNNPADPKTTHWSRRIFNTHLFFREGLTWSLICSGDISFRFAPKNTMISNAAGGIFGFENNLNDLYSLVGALNTKLWNNLFTIINPTLNYSSGIIQKAPLPTFVENNNNEQNIFISKLDWDSRETSWDFQENELIRISKSIRDYVPEDGIYVDLANYNLLDVVYQSYLQFWTEQFTQLHTNEVELNRIFIDIYGLQDELTPEVKLKDITILQEELDYNILGELTEMAQLPDPSRLPLKADEVMRQFVSYAIGCIMGRYRLDRPGLHIAHPNPSEEELNPYEYEGEVFQIDDDAIIPLMDASCGFADNALVRIKAFIRQVWGIDTEIDNINFLEASLGKDLESYLVRDFWKDHCRRYRKRPIYWLFSSSKGAFQVLVYMHRMNKYTVEKIRSNYLLKHIQSLAMRRELLEKESATLDRGGQRELMKIANDLEECRAYELLLKNVADQQIEFDLDDGVKVNYAKFEDVVARIR